MFRTPLIVHLSDYFMLALDVIYEVWYLFNHYPPPQRVVTFPNISLATISKLS